MVNKINQAIDIYIENNKKESKRYVKQQMKHLLNNFKQTLYYEVVENKIEKYNIEIVKEANGYIIKIVKQGGF